MGSRGTAVADDVLRGTVKDLLWREGLVGAFRGDGMAPHPASPRRRS